jgi:hypothetical protein
MISFIFWDLFDKVETNFKIFKNDEGVNLALVANRLRKINKGRSLLTTSGVQTARNVEQPALFRATHSFKGNVIHGVSANSIPGNSTRQNFKS